MRRHKYHFLIAALVVALIVNAWARRSVMEAVTHFMVFLLIILVFLVVFEQRWERIVAFLAGAAALAFNFSRYLPIPESVVGTFVVVHHVLMAGFLGFAVAIILRNIFETKAVTRDDVLGTVCGYILAAAAWANVYNLIAIIAPDSFSVPDSLRSFYDSAGRTALFDYFSVVTLTTMGYGDITPTRPPATAFAMLEAIFGQFYIAIVVAQLVGLRLSQALVPGGPTGK
jgi:hypothetical protein